jgi:hypothetical protein
MQPAEHDPLQFGAEVTQVLGCSGRAGMQSGVVQDAHNTTTRHILPCPWVHRGVQSCLVLHQDVQTGHTQSWLELKILLLQQ